MFTHSHSRSYEVHILRIDSTPAGKWFPRLRDSCEMHPHPEPGSSQACEPNEQPLDGVNGRLGFGDRRLISVVRHPVSKREERLALCRSVNDGLV